MSDDETYRVDDVRDGREASPFDDYVDELHDRPYAELNCPSCQYSIPAADLVQEGGVQCPGCERNVRLHITAHDYYGEWRNVPEDGKEAYR